MSGIRPTRLAYSGDTNSTMAIQAALKLSRARKKRKKGKKEKKRTKSDGPRSVPPLELSPGREEKEARPKRRTKTKVKRSRSSDVNRPKLRSSSTDARRRKPKTPTFSKSAKRTSRTLRPKKQRSNTIGRAEGIFKVATGESRWSDKIERRKKKVSTGSNKETRRNEYCQPASATPLDILPLEILCHIFSYAGPFTLGPIIPLVCQKWNYLLKQEKILGKLAGTLPLYHTNHFAAHRTAVHCLGVWNGHLCTGSTDATIKVWDRHNRCKKTLRGHKNWVTGLCVWKPGRTRNSSVTESSESEEPRIEKLCSSSRDKTVRVWDWNAGECVMVLTHAASVWSLCAWGDWLCSGDHCGTIKVWTRRGECLRQLSLRGSNICKSLHVHRGLKSRDGKYLCATSPREFCFFDYTGNDEVHVQLKSIETKGTNPKFLCGMGDRKFVYCNGENIVFWRLPKGPAGQIFIDGTTLTPQDASLPKCIHYQGGRVFVGTNRGTIQVADPKKKQWTEYRYDNPSDSATEAIITWKGRLYCANGGIINIWE